MKRYVMATVVGLLGLPVLAAAETWKDVPVIDTQCVSKVKADPDKHTAHCALQCQKGGYGLLTPDGAYLKFDDEGNQKALAALKATKKTDHLRATVVGERNGDVVKVTSLSLE
ncbi:MAG: hypothetical protein ACHQNV_03635 [Vicinamibacteria bacterium]